MRLKKINIASKEVLHHADAICFTSNGIIKRDGRLAMGAGVAKVFRDRFKGIDAAAGNCVKYNGNICQRVGFYIWRDDVGKPRKLPLVAFPTKHHWKNPSDLVLIEKSAGELVEMANNEKWETVYLPKPGCNNGGLNFEQVKIVLEKLLDDRFIVTTYG